MTLDTVLGESAMFRLDDASDLPAEMSTRERRILVGALNFHALMAPGRTFAVHLYDGDDRTLPRTTDDSTFTGLSRAFRARSGTLTATSLVEDSGTAEATSRKLIDLPSRHVHVPMDAVLLRDPPRDIPHGTLRRVLRRVRTRFPLFYDEMRDLELMRHRRSYTKVATRRRFDEEFEEGGIHAGHELRLAPAAASGAPRAVLFGLHWFELGGAERWAFESVKIVRDAGFIPIVLTNRESHQPWISREELDGAILIPFSDATVLSQTPGTEELLRSLFRSFDIRGVMVHHNQWLYDRLPWIRASRPGLPIMDSTHIVEYRGGGYPLSGVLADDYITAHHVISPALAAWMTGSQRVDGRKVVMAPLGGLTVDVGEAEFKPRDNGAPFTVAFVGRMARQKAPEVFAAMVRRLCGSGLNARFIMHGDGELSGWVDDLIAEYGIGDRVTRRDSSIPVSRTLDEADLLVVTSHNEGLTLTTLEAIAHGVPVISTDVGAQADIVPSHALFTRRPRGAVLGAARLVARLIDDEPARRALWQEERQAEQALLRNQSASDWFAQEVSTW